MRIFVQFIHLFAPTKIIPPIRHNLIKVFRVEAIVKLTIFKRRKRAGLIQPAVQILRNIKELFLKTNPKSISPLK